MTYPNILVFVGDSDTIAPPPSVRAIAAAAPRASTYQVRIPAGHFGLVVGSRQTSSNETVRLLSAISDLAGSALHRAALHEETERRLRRLNSLRSIDLAINASLDLRHTLEVLLEHVAAQLQVDGARIGSVSPTRIRNRHVRLVW